MQVPPVHNQPYLLSCILPTWDTRRELHIASNIDDTKADINWLDNRPDRQDQDVLRERVSKPPVEIQANSRRIASLDPVVTSPSLSLTGGPGQTNLK